MASSTATPAPFSVPPLSNEEEEKLIVARMANDEKIVRRLARNYHTIDSLSRAEVSSSSAPSESQDSSSASSSKTREEQLNDAREMFLVDLDLFQMLLMKNMQVCEAEARMVEQYANEKERIATEHDALIREIAQLKVTLSEAHTIRKRRMEYDEITEKINALPSRADLESVVARHEEEISVAGAERDQRKAEMKARKREFDLIVSSIQEIRTRGLLKEDSGSGKANEGLENDVGEATGQVTAADSSAPSTSLNPNARPFQPTLNGTPRSGLNSRPSTPKPPTHPAAPSGSTLAVPSFSHHNGTRSGASSPAPPHAMASPRSKADDDDIEMGEVAEEKPPPASQQASPGRPKKTPREELEEGEASDLESVLTELPEEYQI